MIRNPATELNGSAFGYGIFVLLRLLHMLMMLDRLKVYLQSIWDMFMIRILV